MDKIRKKTKKRIIFLLSFYILNMIICTIIFVKLKLNMGILLGFVFYPIFIILPIIIFLLKFELTNNIIKHYSNNPNRTIHWLAKKAGTTDEHVAYTIAKFERKEWDPIKFKTQRAQDALEENSEVLAGILELMNNFGKEKHEVYIDKYYSLIVFKDKLLLRNSRRYEWLFDKSLKMVYLRRISPGFKRKRSIHFSEIGSIIYRNVRDITLPDFYVLMFFLKNEKEIKLYVGRNEQCEKIGVFASKFLNIPFEYDTSKDDRFKIYWE